MIHKIISLPSVFIFFLSLLSTAGTFFFYFPIKSVPVPFLVIGEVIVFLLLLLFYDQYKREHLKKQRLFILFSSAFLSVLFLLSTKGPQDYLKDNNIIIILMTYLGTFILVTVCIALFIFKLKGIEKNKKPAEPKDAFVYAIILFLAGMVYFIAFYPAAMSPDSLSSWAQAHTKEFNDWHPIVFTWTIMILSYIWDSPAILSLFQIIVLSGVFSYSFYQFQKLGIKKSLLIGMCFLIAFIPSYGIYNIIIWKDILFSAALVLFTVHLFLIIHSKGKWFSNKANIVFFFFSSFGVVFLRHNGFPVFVLTMLAFILLYRKAILKVSAPIFVVLVIMHQVLTGPIFKAIDVKPSDPNEALAIPTQQIANIIKNDGNLTPEQLKYYNSIFPIKMWKEKYLPHTVDPIKFSWNDYHRDVIFKDFPKYLKTWGEVVIQNPSLATEAFIKQTALVWEMSTPQYGYTATYINVIMKNDFGLANKTFNDSYTAGINKYLEVSKALPFVKLAWRPAFYAFVIFLFSILFSLKNGWKSSVVLLPFLLNMLSVTAALPAQDFRYLFGNVLISFVFPFIALINPEKEEDTSYGKTAS